jgi:hypothetical protein
MAPAVVVFVKLDGTHNQIGRIVFVPTVVAVAVVVVRPGIIHLNLAAQLMGP